MEGFPFISVYNNEKTVPHSCPPCVATKDLMMAQFTQWEEEAKKLVETKKDANAATFLTPGNFDVIGAHIERWTPHPLFVFYNKERTSMTAIAVFQTAVMADDDGRICALIKAFAVNPKFYGQGIGRLCIERLLREHKDPARMPLRIHGIALLAESSSVTFWHKMGFREFESKRMCTNLEDVKKMKILF